MGQNVFPVPSGTDFFSLTPNVQNHYASAGIAINANSYIDLITINGAGIITEALAHAFGANTSLLPALVIDGTEYPLGSSNGTSAYNVTFHGQNTYVSTASTGYSDITASYPNIRFKTSAVLRIKNVAASAGTWNSGATSRLVALMK